ncbi:glycosyltransferase [Laspinema sp. A4]|uniref:glycosyltransferase n=1 Tax=Laspinema sp. D2d TaxID=2953686 RepID=UPI0021BA9582|nr:glycosyltransferase [Laspinema sp. D2d]MCT7984866.1 glycosyltransferase [Laspinema sp. D2d]
MTHLVPSINPQPEPSTDLPLVSLVILAYNQLDYTRQCLESIQSYTKTPYEIVLVDNGSSDGTDDYFVSVRRQWQQSQGQDAENVKSFCRSVKVILNSENLGYAVGNNQGMALAEGEYIVLLNNDTIVTPGWLECLVNAAQQDPKLGLIGPVSNYVSGLQYIDSVDYETDSGNGLEEFATRWNRENAGEVLYSWRIVGFCLLINRRVIDTIGGLDTRYGIGNFEDDDFCIRSALAGFKSAIARGCFIHHFGSQTFKKKSASYRRELLVKNWEIFKEKWEIPREIAYEDFYDLTEVLQQPFTGEKHFCSLMGGGRAIARNQGAISTVQIPVNSSDLIRVDLGCGPRKPEGYIGVDFYPWPEVDIVADLRDRFPFPDNSVDEVRAHDFIEHLSDRIKTMNEIWRICKPGAMVNLFVPSTDGRGAFQDPTHISYWNINSFMYYAIEFPAYLELCRSYGFQGAFSIVQLDHHESPGQVLHVQAILKAIKPENDLQFIEELNLREINLILVPNWNQPEEDLLATLESAVASVMKHPNRGNITLLIESSQIPENSDIQPNLVLSTIGLNLFYRDDIPSDCGIPEISLLEDPLTPHQWQNLRSQLQYRLAVEGENWQMIEQLGIQNLPIFNEEGPMTHDQ